MLASLLPGYWPIFRPAVEKVDDGGRLQVFGNMILSRVPVLEIAQECLILARSGSKPNFRKGATSGPSPSSPNVTI
jgi:hypothetical protein